MKEACFNLLQVALICGLIGTCFEVGSLWTCYLAWCRLSSYRNRDGRAIDRKTIVCWDPLLDSSIEANGTCLVLSGKDERTETGQTYSHKA